MTGTPSANTNLDNITTNPGSFSLLPTEDGPGSTTAIDISASDEILLLDPTRGSNDEMGTAESYEEMSEQIEKVVTFGGPHGQAHDRHWEKHGAWLLEPAANCEKLIAQIFVSQKPKLVLLNNRSINIDYGEQPDEEEVQREDPLALCREALGFYDQLCTAHEALRSCVLNEATGLPACQGFHRDEDSERTMKNKLACWTAILLNIRRELLDAGATEGEDHIIPLSPSHVYRLRWNPAIPPDLVSDNGTDFTE